MPGHVAAVLTVDDFTQAEEFLAGIDAEGHRRLRRRDKAPPVGQMRGFGRLWSPHRTVATWYSWRMPDEEQLNRKIQSACDGGPKDTEVSHRANHGHHSKPP